jgi:hypothetical protein
MKVEDIRICLAPLASLSYQERWINGGDKDRYVLASEMLEDLFRVQEQLRIPGFFQGEITIAQRAHLDGLFDYMNQHVDEALAGRSQTEQAQLIRDSEVWRTMRERAADALRVFGFPEISKEELEELERHI